MKLTSLMRMWMTALPLSIATVPAYAQTSTNAVVNKSMETAADQSEVRDGVTRKTMTNSLPAKLPVNVLEQLEKQTLAMRAFSAVFEERRLETDPDHPAAIKTFSVVFDANRFYSRRHTLLLDKREEQRTQDIDRAFDGNFSFSGDPKQNGRNPESSVFKYWVADQTDPDRSRLMYQFPYIKAAGFYAPEYLPDLDQFTGVQPLVSYYLQKNDSVEVENVVEGLRVTVEIDNGANLTQQPPRSKHIVTLLLDSKHGYMPYEQQERVSTSNLIVTVKSEGWKYYESTAIWLPQRCTAYYYADPFKVDTFSDHAVFTVIHELKSIEFGHHDAPFTLTLARDYKREGSIILDRTVPEAITNRKHTVSYTVAANGKLLRESARRAGRRGPLWLFLLAVLALPPIAFAFQRRRGEQKN